MAVYYVRSTDGSDASDGLSWANAKATIQGALDIAVAGDRIWVSQVHAESAATDVILISVGTINAPVEVFCGNDAAEPPTEKTTGATVTVTGPNRITIGGVSAYTNYHGIRFNCGTSGSPTLTMNEQWMQATQCTFALGPGSGSGGSMYTGKYTKLIDCHFVFSHAGQQLYINGTVEMFGGSIALTGTVPNTAVYHDGDGRTRFRGVDFSQFGSGKALFDLTVNAGIPSEYIVEQCPLGAGVALTSGANGGKGSVFLDNSDSADTQYRMQRHSYEGDVYSEIVVVREGGARNHKTQPISHKMVSSAGRTFQRPLYGPEFVKRNTATGSQKTISVEILHDSVTPLTDAEVWLEIDYLGVVGLPVSSFANDRKADELASAANQTASVAAWATTGLTNPMKQKLEVTFTARAVGLVRARVALAKPSYTVFVDPIAVIS